MVCWWVGDCAKLHRESPIFEVQQAHPHTILAKIPPCGKWTMTYLNDAFLCMIFTLQPFWIRDKNTNNVGILVSVSNESKVEVSRVLKLHSLMTMIYSPNPGSKPSINPILAMIWIRVYIGVKKSRHFSGIVSGNYIEYIEGLKMIWKKKKGTKSSLKDPQTWLYDVSKDNFLHSCIYRKVYFARKINLRISKNPIISPILGNKINIFTSHQSKTKN